MHSSQCREDIFRLLEPTPSYFFALALYGIGNLEFAGWIGVVAAALVLTGFMAWKVQFNPLVLGINVHLLIITPLIVCLDYFGFPELRDVFIRNSFRGVLITILIVGIGATLWRRNGLLCRNSLDSETIREYSLIMIAACLAVFLWAFIVWQSRIVGVVLPIAGLFLLQAYLARDRKLF